MDVYHLDTYQCRRKVFAITGRVSVFDGEGSVVAFSRQKAFKLREDIGIYTDESERELLLQINARQMIDVAATYDIKTAEGEPVGALRRKGIKSIVKDQWIVLAPGDREIGSIDEIGTGRALARRFIPFVALFSAQEYAVRIDGAPAATFVRSRNPFVSKLDARLERGADRNQRMLILAAASLLLTIEGKQN